MKKNRLFVRLRVEGQGVEGLPKLLRERGIYTFDVFYAKNVCFLSADYVDVRKIFAISRNMCYNIKRLSRKGRYAPLLKLFDKIGLVAGALCFAAFAYASDRRIEEIVFTGDAVGFKTELTAALNAEGIGLGGIITTDDVSFAGEKLALAIDGIAYATVEKRGKRLIVYAVKEKSSVVPIDVRRERIVATEDGVVTKINCLSGVPLVAVGDEVKRGDILIDGIYPVGDGFVKTYALGEVGLLGRFVYEYEAAGKDKIYEARALSLAKEALGDAEIISERSEFAEINGKFIFTVTIERIVVVN